MSGLIDKAKEVLGHESKKNDTDIPSTNAGPHNSNLANKLDPRVDSDQDHRANPGSIVGGYKQGEAEGPFAGSTLGTTGTGGAPFTAGPHDKDLLNEVDPRVDSDKDGSLKVGGDVTNA